MTNPFDIRHEPDGFCYEIYDTRDGHVCDFVYYSDPRDRLPRNRTYTPSTVAEERALHRAAELWAREIADAPIVEPTDNAPVSAPKAPELTETFTPTQFPSVECTITPTSVIELEQDRHRGENSMYLVVDGTRHWLALWFDGFAHQQLLDTCEDVLEAALRVRDRLLRIEFEQQVADEPPAPIPTTRIEYDVGADLFVAYVDGAEVTAAPTQAEVNAALDGLHEGDIVRDALGEVHRVAHIGNGVLPVVTFRAGRLCHWRECDLIKIGA